MPWGGGVGGQFRFTHQRHSPSLPSRHVNILALPRILDVHETGRRSGGHRGILCVSLGARGWYEVVTRVLAGMNRYSRKRPPRVSCGLRSTPPLEALGGPPYRVAPLVSAMNLARQVQLARQVPAEPRPSIWTPRGRCGRCQTTETGPLSPGILMEWGLGGSRCALVRLSFVAA